MRNISEYINEVMSSGSVEIEYTPKDRDELIAAIRYVAKAQSRRKVLNFNCIDTRLVQNMDSVFHQALCAKPAQYKKDFLVDQWDVSNVRSFRLMFIYCTGFTGKGLDNWKVSSKCESTNGMFGGCHSLEEIDMSKWDLSGVNDAGGMFHEAKSLQSAQFPANMPKLDKVNGLFRWCPVLTYAKLPAKILGNIHFASEMFRESGSKHNRLVVDNLDSIVLPKTNGRSVDEYCLRMFYQCGIMPEILREYVKGQKLSGEDIKLLAIETGKI